MCSPKILLFVFLFAFIFSIPLIFTSLAAGISYFLTAVMKFSCFSSKKIRLVSSITRSSSFYVINVSVNTKNNVEKDSIYIGVSVVQTDGRSGGRTVMTKFSYSWCFARERAPLLVRLVLLTGLT